MRIRLLCEYSRIHAIHCTWGCLVYQLIKWYAFVEYCYGCKARACHVQSTRKTLTKYYRVTCLSRAKASKYLQITCLLISFCRCPFLVYLSFAPPTQTAHIRSFSSPANRFERKFFLLYMLFFVAVLLVDRFPWCLRCSFLFSWIFFLI